MITFETQYEFEEAVKAIIRGSLVVDKSINRCAAPGRHLIVQLKVDDKVVSEVILG